MNASGRHDTYSKEELLPSATNRKVSPQRQNPNVVIHILKEIPSRRAVPREVVRMSDAKSETVRIDVRALFAREILTGFSAAAKLLKIVVARDGIEPPTPAFSGPRSTN
jgi:hypothetical protein